MLILIYLLLNIEMAVNEGAWDNIGFYGIFFLRIIQ